MINRHISFKLVLIINATSLYLRVDTAPQFENAMIVKDGRKWWGNTPVISVIRFYLYLYTLQMSTSLLSLDYIKCHLETLHKVLANERFGIW